MLPFLKKKKKVKYYKRDTWKNTDVVLLAPACLPDPPPYLQLTHSPPARLLPTSILSSKAALLSCRNAKPFFQVAQPHYFSFHVSGCAIQQSFVGTCWEGFFQDHYLECTQMLLEQNREISVSVYQVPSDHLITFTSVD